MIYFFFCRQVNWNYKYELVVIRKLFGQTCPLSAKDLTYRL